LEPVGPTLAGTAIDRGQPVEEGQIMRTTVTAAMAVLLAVATIGVMPRPAMAEEAAWPEVFDPAVLRTLNIQMAETDWDFIRKDLTEEYRPGWIWADGEDPILVAIRRKSSRALPSERNPIKVSLKVDINEYVDDQRWHGLNKLSLENGNGPGVVGENLAWAMHRLAGETYEFPVAFANFMRVKVNGTYIGLYLNAEQRDKQALRNRGLWDGGETWLYEQDAGGLILDEGDPDSPAVGHLCYLPFKTKKGCPIPDDATLETDLRAWLDMDNFLTQCAVEALTDNHDSLCSHGKNTFFVDFSLDRIGDEGRKRFYMPWDMDSIFKDPDINIYGVRSWTRKLYQDPYERVILNHPVFRTEYNDKVLLLTDPVTGELSLTVLYAYLDEAEALIGSSLASDPYPTSNAETFDQLKSWLAARYESAREQAIANTNPPPRQP
jgi:hypothetical protein